MTGLLDDTEMKKIIGRKPVVEALCSDLQLERVYILDSLHGPFEKEVRKLCKEKEVGLSRIPKAKLDREVKGNHQGIYALASLIHYLRLEDLLPFLFEKGTDPLILVLDGIQDIRNLGAIARSAEVFGADAMIIPAKRGAQINEFAIKASAGALAKLPVSRVPTLSWALDYLKQSGFQLAGAVLGTSTELDSLQIKGPTVIVLGSEEKGIDRNLLGELDLTFTIPQFGKLDSLNVSVAAGIILYEFSKKRQVVKK